MKNILRSFAITLAVLFSSASIASGFTAVCKADKSHVYNHHLDISGNDMGAEWTDSEKFSSKWTFSYQGGDRLELDGKQVPIIYWNGVVMTAVDQSENNNATDTWVYAINLDLEEIVGAQVNAYRVIAPGIKVRAINFSCDFTRHAETKK